MRKNTITVSPAVSKALEAVGMTAMWPGQTRRQWNPTTSP